MKERDKFSEKDYKILKRRAHMLVQEVPDLKKKKEIVQMLHFSLGNEWYGLKIEYIQSILKVGRIVPLPFTQSFLVGVINVRGKISSVIDLKNFLSLGEVVMSPENMIILVQLNDWETGFLVDEISGVIEVGAGEIESPLVTLGKTESEYILGEFKIGDNFLAVLDFPAILGSDKMKKINC